MDVSTRLSDRNFQLLALLSRDLEDTLLLLGRCPNCSASLSLWLDDLGREIGACPECQWVGYTGEVFEE